MQENKERILAYQEAFLIEEQDLEKVGGAKANLVQATCKQTLSTQGYWDFGVDVVGD